MLTALILVSAGAFSTVATVKARALIKQVSNSMPTQCILDERY